MAQPLAVLMSKCGAWHFYDLDALQLALSSLPVASDRTAESGAMPSEITAAGHGGVGDPHSVVVFPRLQECFPIETWVAYGKLNAKVATTVCKENGRLKTRLRSLSQAADLAAQDPSRDKHYVESRREDPLSLNDPWLGTRLAEPGVHSIAQSSCDWLSAEAWS